MIVFRAVPKSDIPIVWGQAWPLLNLAVRRWRRRFDEKAIFTKLAAADAQLWVAIDAGKIMAAGLTEVVDYPCRRALNILAAGGAGDDLWADWMEQLERWALEVDCDIIEIRGRDGWLRVLKERGFEKDCMVLVKELSKPAKLFKGDVA